MNPESSLTAFCSHSYVTSRRAVLFIVGAMNDAAEVSGQEIVSFTASFSSLMLFAVNETVLSCPNGIIITPFASIFGWVRLLNAPKCNTSFAVVLSLSSPLEKNMARCPSSLYVSSFVPSSRQKGYTISGSIFPPMMPCPNCAPSILNW